MKDGLNRQEQTLSGQSEESRLFTQTAFVPLGTDMIFYDGEFDPGSG